MLYRTPVVRCWGAARRVTVLCQAVLTFVRIRATLAPAPNLEPLASRQSSKLGSLNCLSHTYTLHAYMPAHRNTYAHTHSHTHTLCDAWNLCYSFGIGLLYSVSESSDSLINSSVSQQLTPAIGCGAQEVAVEDVAVKEVAVKEVAINFNS